MDAEVPAAEDKTTTGKKIRTDYVPKGVSLLHSFLGE
jgi:hypothetical protein